MRQCRSTLVVSLWRYTSRMISLIELKFSTQIMALLATFTTYSIPTFWYIVQFILSRCEKSSKSNIMKPSQTNPTLSWEIEFYCTSKKTKKNQEMFLFFLYSDPNRIFDTMSHTRDKREWFVRLQNKFKVYLYFENEKWKRSKIIVEVTLNV